MIDEVVDIKFEQNGNKIEMRAHIESIVNGTLTIRSNTDASTQVHMSDVTFISLVEDEDEVQEFTMDRLHSKKTDMITELAADCLNTFDQIINFCPENYDSLMDELKNNIEGMIDMRAEESN